MKMYSTTEQSGALYEELDELQLEQCTGGRFGGLLKLAVKLGKVAKKLPWEEIGEGIVSAAEDVGEAIEDVFEDLGEAIVKHPVIGIGSWFPWNW